MTMTASLHAACLNLGFIDCLGSRLASGLKEASGELETLGRMYVLEKEDRLLSSDVDLLTEDTLQPYRADVIQ